MKKVSSEELGAFLTGLGQAMLKYDHSLDQAMEELENSDSLVHACVSNSLTETGIEYSRTFDVIEIVAQDLSNIESPDTDDGLFDSENDEDDGSIPPDDDEDDGSIPPDDDEFPGPVEEEDDD